MSQDKGEFMNKLVIALGLTSIVAVVGCAADPPVTEPVVEEVSTPEPTGVGEQPLAAPPDFRILGITGHGPGCRSPGSLTYELTEDKLTFTVYFADMILQHAPHGPTLQTTQCTAALNLHVPQGWMFSVATINTRGYVNIPAGVSAEELSNYSFAGVPFMLMPHSALLGPRNENYVFTDQPGIVSSVSSPCGMNAILNIETRMILNTAGNPNKDALFTVDQVDGKFVKVFHITWRKC